MPWVIGSSSALSWADARTKVRGDLWRSGSQGIPDDVIDRALHASIREIEAARRWLYLENIDGTIVLEEDANSLPIPASCGKVNSLAVAQSEDVTTTDVVLRAPLQAVRDSANNSVSVGLPTYYAVSGETIYLDGTAPEGTRFELVFDERIAEMMEDAVDQPSVTLALHQQAVLANAKHFVCAEFLHDDDKAVRQRAAYERHLRTMEDSDDLRRCDVMGGEIVPNDTLFVAAHGFRN